MKRLQAALYVLVAAVLALVLLDRGQAYMALAERATIDATLNRTLSALYLRVGYDRMQGRLSGQWKWEGHNPFELAKMRVDNFAGEVDTMPAPDALPRGAWLYSRAEGELVYRPSYPKGLAVEDGSDFLRFRLLSPKVGTVPRLEAVVPYRWEP